MRHCPTRAPVECQQGDIQNSRVCVLQPSEEPPAEYRFGPYVPVELREGMGLDPGDDYEPDPRDFMDDEDDDKKKKGDKKKGEKVEL